MPVSIDPNLLGWHRDDDAVAAFCATLDASGTPNSFGAGKPDLQGHWKRTVASGLYHVLAQTFERKVFGTWKDPDSQRRGTCVSRGTYRMAQDSLCYELANNLTVGRKATLCFEPIYGGSRVTIGRGQLGNSDGSVGAWAAEFLWKYGVIERGIYGGVDLRAANEQLAVLWGNPHAGPPAEILAASKLHPFAVHRVYNTDELADAISCGYFGAYCSNLIWGDRDANGMSRPESRGGHCEEICGVFLTPSKHTAFQRQQSWGLLPNGPDTLQTASGPIKLRPGSYGAYAGDMQRGLDEGGECWVGKPLIHFRDSLKELLS